MFSVVYLPDQLLGGIKIRRNRKWGDSICDMVTRKASDKTGRWGAYAAGTVLHNGQLWGKRTGVLHSLLCPIQPVFGTGLSRKGNINFSKEALFGWGQFSKGLLENGHQYSSFTSYEEWAAQSWKVGAHCRRHGEIMTKHPPQTPSWVLQLLEM